MGGSCTQVGEPRQMNRQTRRSPTHSCHNSIVRVRIVLQSAQGFRTFVYESPNPVAIWTTGGLYAPRLWGARCRRLTGDPPSRRAPGAERGASELFVRLGGGSGCRAANWGLRYLHISGEAELRSSGRVERGRVRLRSSRKFRQVGFSDTARVQALRRLRPRT